MADSDSRGVRLLVLPHVGVSGGAGIYNCAAIARLAHLADVTLIGPSANAYVDEKVSCSKITLPPRPILPAYQGASIVSFILYLFLLPIQAISLLSWTRRHMSELNGYDAFIVTSSIDLPTLAVMGFVCKRPSRICFVQENVILSGVRGAISKILLRHAKLVVSITQAWSNRAAREGVHSLVTPNPFESRDVITAIDDSVASTDLLFVGGGARNKGFQLFLEIVEKIASKRKVKVTLLGELAPRQMQKAAKLAKSIQRSGSRIDYPGFVKDTAKYYQDTRLLLLPITAPHFCRPAVEAGFHDRTFIISDLPEISDFAVENHNCMFARSGDASSWVTKIELLLDNPSERRLLARGNKRRSLDHFSSEAFDRNLAKVVQLCR